MCENCKQIKSDINEQIELLRNNLHILISQHGINSKEVLKCSEELDELIYKLKCERYSKKTSADNL